MVKNPPAMRVHPSSTPGLGRSAGERTKLPTPVFRPGERPGLYSLWSRKESFFFLEEEMATCYSTLAWRIPWTEEPGGLQSLGLQGVRRDLATEKQQQAPH